MTSFMMAARRLSGLAALLCGWRPDEFWRATPQELADVVGTLIGGTGELVAMDGATVRALMERFPDG
jgi:uncharacterized phage protein (TIGR02216 family)